MVEDLGWDQDCALLSSVEFESFIQCFLSFDPRHPLAVPGVVPASIPAASKELLDLITTANRQAMPQYVGCLICQKEFKQKPTLLQRGCVHIEARPYPCTECGKRFRQQSHLTQHLRIHSDKKPYECMYCGKAFRQRTTLNQHLRIHSDKKLFDCSYCGRSFRQPTTLAQHIRIHTDKKPYECTYCGRFFRQRTTLNQHIRIHTDEKPYKCSECGKDFRQKAILDQHYRTHLGDDRSFCCPISSCRRRFHTEEQMNRHLDNHPALRGEPGGPPAKRSRAHEHQDNKPQELYMPQGYAQAAAAAAAFQQQYTLQLLQPPSTANSQPAQ